MDVLNYLMAMTMAVMTPEFNNCDEVAMMTSGRCLTCSVPRHTLPVSNMNAQMSQMRHFSQHLLSGTRDGGHNVWNNAYTSL